MRWAFHEVDVYLWWVNPYSRWAEVQLRWVSYLRRALTWGQLRLVLTWVGEVSSYLKWALYVRWALF